MSLEVGDIVRITTKFTVVERHQHYVLVETADSRPFSFRPCHLNDFGDHVTLSTLAHIVSVSADTVQVEICPERYYFKPEDLEVVEKKNKKEMAKEKKVETEQKKVEKTEEEKKVEKAVAWTKKVMGLVEQTGFAEIYAKAFRKNCIDCTISDTAPATSSTDNFVSWITNIVNTNCLYVGKKPLTLRIYTTVNDSKSSDEAKITMTVDASLIID